METGYVLILGASLMQRPCIEAVKEIGYKVFLVDANDSAVCVPYADRFEKIDLKDTERLCDLASSMGDELKAVFTAGTDFSFTVSRIAERCNLISHSVDSAMKASDKLLMRKIFKEKGVPCPDFFEINEGSDIEEIADEQSFPKVIKPCDNMGARGCRLVRNKKEFLSAAKNALGYSRSHRVIVEEYMDGSEYSIDALVVDGRIIITGFADRHIYFEPYFVEMGHSMPSDAPEEVKREIIETFEMGIKALGLTNGAAKGDVKYTKKGAMIGEIAGRLSGGYMSGWTFPYASNFPLVKEALMIALGRPADFSGVQEISCKAFSAERAFISIPGRIKKIYGEEDARCTPFVRNVFFRVGIGDHVDFPRNNVEKCGNVISASTGENLAKNAAETAVSRIVLRLCTNNARTNDFLLGNENYDEAGFPYVAFEGINVQGAFFDKTPFIDANESTRKFFSAFDFYDAIRDRKDWNHRSVDDTLILFDKLCYDHVKMKALPFFSVLIRGGIQGVLYYADSLQENNHEV